MEEEHPAARGDASRTYVGDEARHRLAGVHRIEQQRLVPRRHCHRLAHRVVEPEGGKGLLVAVTLLKEQNRTGKRKLPDIVPMPFPGKHWESLSATGFALEMFGSRAVGIIAASTPTWGLSSNGTEMYAKGVDHYLPEMRLRRIQE